MKNPYDETVEEFVIFVDVLGKAIGIDDIREMNLYQLYALRSFADREIKYRKLKKDV